MDAGAAIGPRFQIGIVPHVAAAQDGSGDAAISGDIGTKLRDQIAVLALRWQAHFEIDRPADAALARFATEQICGVNRDLAAILLAGPCETVVHKDPAEIVEDRKSTRLNYSH